jgi:DNA-binding CsgD family transcriptional regulator
MATRHQDGSPPILDPWSAQWTASIAAASNAADPVPYLKSMLAQLGFDHLTCIGLAHAYGGGERLSFIWSTAPASWTARYGKLGYAAHDPRIRLTTARVSPIVWDAREVDGDWSVRRFLNDAGRHGVRSGFAVSFRDAEQGRVVIAFDSARSPVTETRCATQPTRMGDLMLLAAALQEGVLRPRCMPAVATIARGAGCLSPRERTCLSMAAHGLTSADIGTKLGIAERTVNFHIRNVLKKLQALNRTEAIAKAVARGVVDATAIAQRSA